MSVKSKMRGIIRRLFPRKLYKLIANRAILVPAYYKTIIEDVEKCFDLSLLDSDEKELLLMRKYGHILDKGLHRKDLAPGHGKQIYNCLKDSVERLKKTKYSSDPTLFWAEGKLQFYEQVQRGEISEPLKGERSDPGVSFDEFAHLVKSRRSNRDFNDEIVPDEIIRQLKELANWASSSCNKQPIEIYATNNPELAKKCLACCKGGTGFSENIPSFWCFTADILGYVWPSEIYLPVIDTCLGIQNVMLGATTLGLSGTLLSWAQKSKDEEQELRRLLNIPYHHQIILCAVIGFSYSEFLTPVRKSV